MTSQTSNDLAITTLAYEKINDQYSKAKYGEFNVIMDITTGYINSTKLCADGGKQLKNWTRNEGNKELIEYFENSHRLKFEPMTKIVTGGQNTDLRGTYAHPKLITHIASWVSPAFAWKVSEIVNNFLVREKEDEIRALTGDKSRLEKMFEDSDKRREESEKRAEEMLLKMTRQNEKTHITLETTNIKLDNTTKTLEKAEIDNAKIKTTLKRVETRIDLIVDEIAPPTRQVSLHEEFGVMKLNDPTNSKQYKVYCSQKRGVAKAKNSILKSYPNAVMFKEVTPNANAKNFLHILKEKYGSNNNNSKIKVSYNFINLKSGILEEELNTMINEVVESAKNYGK
jgi:hypothetical protein